MRLLNIDSLRLESFNDDDVPQYAILSHRWGKREISYTRMHSGKNLTGPGYDKIMSFCDMARRRSESSGKEYQHVWADSCCIDRRDSAELSGSINSMFEYYAQSSECLVYLSDIRMGASDLDPPLTPHQALGASSWFSRGWTLQELLAPKSVLFFDATWSLMGHKCWCECSCSITSNGRLYGADLTPVISSITGIAVEYLKGLKDVTDATIAFRMSWACFRHTERKEDEAYCLQGLFNVKMPTIYGEGRSRAFLRLQEEIMKQSWDQSIFAWIAPPEPSSWPKTHIYARSLVASSPIAFFGCGEVIEVEGRPENSVAYTMKNKGIKLRARSQRALYRKIHVR